jgi:CHAT domain-containing protein/tetratricopeptide (TPR) repeat protein
MNEFDQKIIQLAATYTEPQGFIDVLEGILCQVTTKEKANVFLQSAITLFNFSYFDLALNASNHALKYFQAIDEKAREARCYTYLGMTYHSLGDFRRAIEYHEKSLKIAEETKDKPGQAGCYTNLGIAYRSIGEFRKAIKYHMASLEIAKHIKHKPGEGKCCSNLGNTYDSLGDFRRAIEYHEKSLKIAEETKDKAGEAGYLTNLGTTYHRIGEFIKAAEYYKKALDTIRHTGKRGVESICYGGLGNIYYSLREFRNALEHYKKSLAIAKAIGDRVGESRCYTNLGNTSYSLGSVDEAIKYHETSLDISVDIGDKDGEANSYGNLGLIYNSMGDFQRAIESHKSSLEIARKTGDVDRERVNNLNLGVAYYNREPETAYNYFKKSIDLSEAIGRSLIDEQNEIGFYGVVADAYKSMIPLCMQLEKEEEAFHYTERSKSKAFLDMLSTTDLKPSDKLIEKKSLLDDEDACLTSLREIQMRHLTGTAISVELGEVDGILRKLSELHDEMETIDPEYVFMRRGKPLSLDIIRETITCNLRDAVLVEYFATDDKLFIFVVSKKGLHVKPISISKEKLLSLIDAYRGEPNGFQGMIGNTWLELSKYLIESISEYLSQSDLIYLIPYGALHYLPIHALELNGDPLIKNHPVCYCPAASIIPFCKNKGSGKLEYCASFGIVFEEEAKGVAKLFDTVPYRDKTATKKNVIECVNNDIIHLSCHGYFDNLDPLSSGILLHDKEVLTAREIFNLRINAELVTLSACETGRNERRPGDELIGLTRAFLYAGAPSVVVSLWSVNANSTQELMFEFYRLLRSGKDKARALQGAQIEIMKQKEYALPYFWAPFVLVGDWE